MSSSGLTVDLQLLGQKIPEIQSYTLTAGYLQPFETFSFKADAPQSNRDILFGIEREPVAISLDGARQLLGRIGTSDGTDTNARNFTGRDYREMLQSHVDPCFHLTEGMDVAAAVTAAASPVGISTVVSPEDIAMRNVLTGKSIVTGKVQTDLRKAKLTNFTAKSKETIYDCINRIAARHHSTIQASDQRDSLVIGQPDYDQEPLYEIVRREGDPSRNIVKSGKCKRDFSGLPTYFMGTGEGGAPTETSVGLRQDLSILSLEEEHGFSGQLFETLGGLAVNERLHTGLTLGDPLMYYRLFNYKDKQAQNSAQLHSSNRRYISELLRKTMVYHCTLSGHIDPKTKALWAIDTIAHVVDEKERVDDNMWIANRTFSWSPSAGRQTRLELWLPGTYQIGG